MLRRHLFAFAVASLAVVGCDEKKTEAPVPPAQSGMPAVQPTGSNAALQGAAKALANAQAAPSGATVAPSGATAAPSGDTGSITGVVTVTGKLPVMEDLKRNSDAFCAKKQMKDESVVADDKGHLANVLVHVIGLPATTNPPKEKATISQDDCMYRPRVLGVVDGQPLDIRNGDPVLHNVHSYEGARTLFNVAQVPGMPNIEKTFTQNGVMLKMKCDVHQWMTGFVWVQNNGFFAVTDKDGKFEIKDVPVGTYDVEAWHERFGTKPGKVTIVKGKPAELKLEFSATQTASK